MKFSVYQVSRRGGRPINEDRLGYTYTREAVLLALADGMGGHPEGEKAADMVVRTYTERFAAEARPRLADPMAFLESTLLLANDAIVRYAQDEQMSDNPRTTVVAAVMQDGQLYALHSGDSRLYWVRKGRLVRRTRDHSYHDKPELFRKVPAGVNRSVLFTCVGSATMPLYDLLGPEPLQGGDRLLLCSDGLWSVMDDDTLAAQLHGTSLEDAVRLLSDEAVRKGGAHGDNVSLLALEWELGDGYDSTQVIAAEPDAQALEAEHSGPISAFDEAAIERSIAEINDAIRRTAQHKPR